MIRLVFTLKNIEYIQLISDAMRAAGMPDGQYDLGGLNVNVANGAARLDNGALAGSTLLICDALKNVFEITEFELKELVKTTSYIFYSQLVTKISMSSKIRIIPPKRPALSAICAPAFLPTAMPAKQITKVTAAMIPAAASAMIQE